MPQTATQQKRQAKAPAKPVSEPARPTGKATEDHVYGLVSVLYHALQGAQTYQQYIEDARKASDDDLAKFFEECREEETARAARAKQLLVDRVELEEDDDEEGEDDEAEDEDEE